MNVTVTPHPLRGTVQSVVSSKSHAHRLLICAALADRPTILQGVDPSADLLATVRCLRALGADIAWEGAGLSVTPLSSPCKNALLDCGESGSTLRFLLPVAAALGADCAFTGQGKLKDRPLSPLREAMEDHGLLVSGSSIYQGSYSWETGFAYGEHIIKKGLDFTAVFIGNYQMAEGFIDCMHDYGVIIPDRISVICFDETPEMRRNRITTICARADKMAGSAADLLIRQIEDPTVQSRRIYEEPVLIKRGSVKRLI